MFGLTIAKEKGGKSAYCCWENLFSAFVFKTCLVYGEYNITFAGKTGYHKT
jgi:hypothetical protein